MLVRVEVVYGPPCSGKSTHVQERLGSRDIVYDYDRLLAAITDRHQHLAAKHPAHMFVIDFRFRLLDRLRCEAEIDTAYIITRWPTQALMDALDGLDTEFVRIEANRTDCYDRLDDDATRPDKDEWRAVIDGWFDKYGGLEPVTKNEGGHRLKKFWNWIRNEDDGARTLYLNGVIAEDSWFEDDVTPKAFKAELMSGSGDIEVYINSPGGDCIAASQIYTMLMEYPHNVTIKIDGLAASAASVIAMAGTTVLMAPTALMMVHNPLTVALGDTAEMRKAIALLDEVKESILNAYELKTSQPRAKLAQMMDAETWLSAGKAVELGFADAILQRSERSESMVEDNLIFSRRAVTASLLDKLREKNPPKPGTPIADLDKRLSLLQ